MLKCSRKNSRRMDNCDRSFLDTFATIRVIYTMELIYLSSINLASGQIVENPTQQSGILPLLLNVVVIFATGM